MKKKYIRFWIESSLRLVISAVILTTCLLCGRSLSLLFDGVLPGSIIGMLLLTLSLSTGLAKLRWVLPGTNLLLRWLSLLFIPISVALVEHLDLLAQHGLSILLTIALSTALVLAFAGRAWQWLEQR